MTGLAERCQHSADRRRSAGRAIQDLCVPRVRSGHHYLPADRCQNPSMGAPTDSTPADDGRLLGASALRVEDRFESRSGRPSRRWVSPRSRSGRGTERRCTGSWWSRNRRTAPRCRGHVIGHRALGPGARARRQGLLGPGTFHGGTASAGGVIPGDEKSVLIVVTILWAIAVAIGAFVLPGQALPPQGIRRPPNRTLGLLELPSHACTKRRCCAAPGPALPAVFATDCATAAVVR